MTQLPAADQALLLFLIVLCLGSCFVRLFWQLEQVRTRRCQREQTKLDRSPQSSTLDVWTCGAIACILTRRNPHITLI